MAPASVTYTNNTAKAIVDQGITTSTIQVSDSFSMRDVNVRLNITRGRDSDLQVFLIGLDGTRIEPFNGVGGNGDDFQNTIWDDAASTSIISANAPFAGTYRPSSSLSLLDVKTVTGAWTLEVRDNTRLQTGTLNSWSFTVER
jgi:subtilisin-like proprotein convertase family protein